MKRRDRIFSLILVAGVAISACCATGQDKTPPLAPQSSAKTNDAPAGSDGEKIVFASNRSGAWRIWITNPDGSSPKQLLERQNSNDQDVDPVFTADRKAIVFASTSGGKVGIWMMNVDGSQARRICDGDQGESSPDGKQIVLRENDKIWIHEIGSGAEKQIVPDDFKICSFPVWSPDGKRVAFACRWEPKGDNSLWIVDVGSGKPVKLYDKKPASGPHWSPDGSLLVYETETHICTIKPDGTGNRLVTYYGGVQRFGRWSPDGKRIVYCQGVSEQGPWDLYIVPAAGGNPVKITEGGSNLNADWR